MKMHSLALAGSGLLVSTACVSAESAALDSGNGNVNQSVQSVYELVETKKTCGDEFHPSCYGNFETCLRVAEYLKTKQNEPPMICKQEFDEVMGFSRPKWEPVPSAEINWEVLRQLFEMMNKYRFTNPPDMLRYWQEEKQAMEKWVVDGRQLLWKAKFNIDNRGGEEVVYRVTHPGNECVQEKYLEDIPRKNVPSYMPKTFKLSPATPLHYVLDSTGKNLDYMFEGVHDAVQEFFFLQGKTYGTRWYWNGGYGEEGGDLHIEQLSNAMGDRAGHSLACSFRYLDDKGANK